MNCKHIREIIMTDYIDGEASGPVKDRIKAHLAVCADCAAFEQAVLKNTAAPFKDIERVQPPAEVWNKIREAIKQDQPVYAGSFLERMFDFLRESFFVRRPAYALATAFTVILVTVVYFKSPMRQQMLVNDYLSDRSAFLVAMNKAPNGDLDRAVSFNTAIEEYLF